MGDQADQARPFPKRARLLLALDVVAPEGLCLAQLAEPAKDGQQRATRKRASVMLHHMRECGLVKHAASTAGPVDGGGLWTITAKGVAWLRRYGYQEHPPADDEVLVTGVMAGEARSVRVVPAAEQPAPGAMLANWVFGLAAEGARP